MLYKILEFVSQSTCLGYEKSGKMTDGKGRWPWSVRAVVTYDTLQRFIVGTDIQALKRVKDQCTLGLTGSSNTILEAT